MKKFYFTFFIVLFNFTIAQNNSTIDYFKLPFSSFIVDSFDIKKAEKTKNLYSVSITKNTSINKSDFALTEITQDRNKIYRYRIHSDKAQGLMIFFKNVNLANGATINVFGLNTYKKQTINNKNRNIDNKAFADVIYGEDVIIEYIEPKDIVNDYPFEIEKIHHFFRGLKTLKGFNDSESCMLNVNCSEGNLYKNSASSVVKIYVTGTSNGYCSGTVLNNSKEDKSPIVLTANHCSQNSTVNDLSSWIFYFNYELTGCNNSLLEPQSNNIYGSTALAYSSNDNGEYSSDFLLLKLSSNIPDAWGVNYTGWNRNSSSNTNGVSIHHPNSDVKKISTYNTAPQIGSYQFGSGTHYIINWSKTANGFSVTQEGSSGSGLFNSNGLLIGSLTGGYSKCNNPDGEDYYGRLFYSWDQYSNNSLYSLKSHLDPLNLGISELNSLIVKRYVGIDNIEATEDFDFTVFDNKIKINNILSQDLEVNISNLLGQNILNSKINSNEEIDLSGLEKGVFIVNVKSTSKSISRKYIN